jgi:hypothetical protein
MLLGLEDDVTDLQSQKRTALPISSELGPLLIPLLSYIQMLEQQLQAYREDPPEKPA